MLAPERFWVWVTQLHPSTQGPLEFSPLQDQPRSSGGPSTTCQLLPRFAEAQQSPHQSTSPCHRIPMGKAPPLPPPHMSEGWPPWVTPLLLLGVGWGGPGT